MPSARSAWKRRSFARRRLQRQEREDRERRARHAAGLIRDFGRAAGPTQRLWSAMALTLYPEDTMPLLVNALGHLDSDAASAVELALVSLGAESLPHLTAVNRISCLKDDEHARRLREKSRETIGQILLHLGQQRDDLSGLDLEGVDLSGLHFAGSRLRGVVFRKTVLSRCNGGNFERTDLNRISASKVVLAGATLRRVFLCKAHLTGANMRNSDFHDGVMNALKAPGVVAVGARFQNCNLGGADLARADMEGALFAGCNLGGVNLARARLHGTVFRDCNLSSAVFDGAELHGASFEGRNEARTLSGVGTRGVEKAAFCEGSSQIAGLFG